METGYAEVDGGRRYYETAGMGPALVLIHAGFLDGRMWDPQIPVFSKTHRVIWYDVRGFGKSEIVRSTYSDYKDLRALLYHLTVKTASLVGVSNGGRIAADFAVEYPSMLDHLVLVSPGMSGYNSKHRRTENALGRLRWTTSTSKLRIRGSFKFPPSRERSTASPRFAYQHLSL